jgi:anti-anti-sigma regulatory factor
MRERAISQSIGQDLLTRTRERRIKTFITILATLNLPFLILGLVDLSNSSLALIRALVAYAYYGIYYLLLRAGYGVVATYLCVLLLLVLIASGVHDTGGALTSMATLYALLLIGAATVLNDTRAIDATIMLCIAGYGGLALYEFAFAPPPVRLLRPLYVTPNVILAISLIVTTLVSLVGIWLIVRSNIVGLRQSTAAMENARAEAEARARENATLAEQVQASNTTLLTTEARLRETVDALALPLIPLDEGVILLPLVGYLDNRRAERLVSGLLEGIHDQRARAVVIDITGLREVDAQVAGALLRAAGAARLLGAEVVLSGISADAARELGGFGTDIGGLRTAGSLGDALRLAAGAR